MRLFRLTCAFAFLLGLFIDPVARSQTSGIVLLHKMQRALGGANQIVAIHDLDWTVRAETFDHHGKRIGEVTKRTRWIRPNFLRLDQVGPGDTYVLYFDGKRGWEILPGQHQAINLAGSELEFANKYLSGFMLNLWVADRVGGYDIDSSSENVIRFSRDGNTFKIALDPATSLPTNNSKWTNVDGVLFPAKSFNSHKNDGSAEITTIKVGFNIGLDPRNLAAKPDDLKPNLDH